MLWHHFPLRLLMHLIAATSWAQAAGWRKTPTRKGRHDSGSHPRPADLQGDLEQVP